MKIRWADLEINISSAFPHSGIQFIISEDNYFFIEPQHLEKLAKFIQKQVKIHKNRRDC